MSHVELQAYAKTTMWNFIFVQDNVQVPDPEIHEPDEAAQQAHPGNNNGDIMEDLDAIPDAVLEQLGGVIFQQIMHEDGQVDLLVLVIDACAETPDVL